MNKTGKKKTKKERLKPISLYPLEVEEALESLLKIKPIPKEKHKSSTK